MTTRETQHISRSTPALVYSQAWISTSSNASRSSRKPIFTNSKALNFTLGNNTDTSEYLGLGEVAEFSNRQDCYGRNIEFIVSRKKEFIDWDIQYSPVINIQQARRLAPHPYLMLVTWM